MATRWQHANKACSRLFKQLLKMLSKSCCMLFTGTIIPHILPKSDTRPFTEFNSLCVLKPTELIKMVYFAVCPCSTFHTLHYLPWQSADPCDNILIRKKTERQTGRLRNCSDLRKCGVCASVKHRNAARLTDGKRQQEKTKSRDGRFVLTGCSQTL